MNYPGLPSAKIDHVYLVTQQYENNLPALSTAIYGNEKYWDLLFLANNIDDPLDVPVGLRLMVPNLTQALKSTDDGTMK